MVHSAVRGHFAAQLPSRMTFLTIRLHVQHLGGRKDIKAFSQSWQKNTGKWVDPAVLTKSGAGSARVPIAFHADLHRWGGAVGELLAKHKAPRARLGSFKAAAPFSPASLLFLEALWYQTYWTLRFAHTHALKWQRVVTQPPAGLHPNRSPQQVTSSPPTTCWSSNQPAAVPHLFSVQSD